MKTKLLTLLLAVAASVGTTFAARDVVPSDAVLANYYEPGQLCVCIFVPAELDCSQVVFPGTYNRDANDGWITDVKTLAKFEPVEGYDGWYVLAVNDETPADFQSGKGIQGKPVVLDQDGNFNWAYQVGDVTVIRGGVTVVAGFSGEIDLVGYTKDAPNVFIINALKANANPCTAVYHNYTITVISDGCEGFAVPYLIGDMTDWGFQQMQVNVEKTQELGAPVYYYNFKCAEGTRYQVLSGLKAADGSIAEYPTWDAISYLEQLVDDVWVRYTENGNVDLTTGANVNITFDVRQKNLRWARCTSEDSSTISGTCGDNVTWTLSNGTLTISGTGAMADYYDYNSPFYDYRYRSSIKSVIINDGVTSIGDWAFYNCSSLTSVTIGNSVTSIGAAAFRGCSSLTSITIPNSVTNIGDRAFYDCSSLTSLVYNAHCFAYMPTSYSGAYAIPEGIKQIAGGAFDGCYKLTSVTIPNSVTSIGQSAFYRCTCLTSITIPNSVTSIGGWAFFDCIHLTSVTVKAETPPTLGSYAFYNEYYNTNYPIYVPCDTLDTYKTAWADYASRIKDAPLPYKISTHAKNGNVDIASLGNYTTCDTEPYYKLTAVPNYGYHFVQWNDGNTDNPRTIILASDTSFTAEFAHNPIITYVYNSQMGTVSGPTITTTGVAVEYITFNATPNYGCHFTQWSDGLKDNPRIAQITQDTTFTAEFAYDRVGTCGKDLALVWSYDPNSKVLTIGNAGEFTENMRFGVEAPNEMEELVIGNSVTAIGENAFAGISTLKKVTIGESVKTIHNNAFYNCVNLETIFNYRPTPTNAYSTAFDGVDKFACSLYVLPSSIDMYKNASVWRDFYYTYAIGAEETTVTTNNVTVEPQDNAATVTWPTSENAATYTIEITKDGEVFCTLIFNANGQLTGIAFAPSRDGQAHAPAAIMTANGLQFTVTGLNSNTQYGYNLTAKDANDQTVATYSGSFTTTSEGIATGVEEISSSLQGGDRGRLILRDGQVLILRNGKTYTMQGQEVK